MAQDTLLVCILCRCSQTEEQEQQTSLSDGQSLFNRLQDGLKTIDNSHCIRLQSVRCMGACDRACVAAFMATNKLTFILSQLSPTDAVPDLWVYRTWYANVACYTKYEICSYF